MHLEPLSLADNGAHLRPILPAHIDSTMRSAFVKCPQSFFREFILGLRPSETSVHLHFGATVSGTLERFYHESWTNHATKPLALARAHETYLRLWGDYTPPDKSPKSKENAWYAVDSYINTYPPAADPVQPYFVGGEPTYEFSFAIPLDDPAFPRHPVSGDPFVYVGRADLIGQWNGRPVIRDEKTAGQLEQNWSEKWDLRAQFLGYCWAAQRGGIQVETVIVRGIIVTKTQIRQVEAVKLYSQWEIDRWYTQLARDLARLVACWRDDWFDFNLADSCTSYGGCPFVPMCKSPDPNRWLSQYKVERWNPLNRNPTNAAQSQAFDAVKTVHIGDAKPPTPS